MHGNNTEGGGSSPTLIIILIIFILAYGLHFWLKYQHQKKQDRVLDLVWNTNIKRNKIEFLTSFEIN